MFEKLFSKLTANWFNGYLLSICQGLGHAGHPGDTSGTKAISSWSLHSTAQGLRRRKELKMEALARPSNTNSVLAGGRSLPCAWVSKRRSGWWGCREDRGVSQVRKLAPAETELIIGGPQAGGGLLHWVSVTASSGKLLLLLLLSRFIRVGLCATP